MKLFIILLCLGYIGWPAIDFIPDVTLFVGTVDDSLAGAIAGLVFRSYFASGGKN